MRRWSGGRICKAQVDENCKVWALGGTKFCSYCYDLVVTKPYPSIHTWSVKKRMEFIADFIIKATISGYDNTRFYSKLKRMIKYHLNITNPMFTYDGIALREILKNNNIVFVCKEIGMTPEEDITILVNSIKECN